MISRLFLTCLLSSIALISLFGDPINDAPRPSVDVPPAVTIPAITADAGDPAWREAAAIPPAAFSPSLGGDVARGIHPPETEVLLLWSPCELDVRFLCRGAADFLPYHGHDARIYRGDAVEIFLDPAGDSRQWFEIEVNATNDTLERSFLCQGQPLTSPSLRLTGAVVAHEVREFPHDDLDGLRTAAGPWIAPGNDKGWIVDVAIPAASILRRLGATHFSPMTLRADFLRYEWPAPAVPGGKRRLIATNWSPVAFGGPHHSPAAYGFVRLVAAPR